MNTPTPNKTNVSQATAAPACLSRRAAFGYALNLVAFLAIGASYLSSSTSRHDEHDSESKRSEQENMWDTEWGEIPF
ncbi:MAG: hypothetical protein H7Y38_07965 [Armatimonadetes bacterium]|nr:hypothetical protein [Armatimonadota bacterium]